MHRLFMTPFCSLGTMNSTTSSRHNFSTPANHFILQFNRVMGLRLSEARIPASFGMHLVIPRIHSSGKVLSAAAVRMSSNITGAKRSKKKLSKTPLRTRPALVLRMGQIQTRLPAPFGGHGHARALSPPPAIVRECPRYIAFCLPSLPLSASSLTTRTTPARLLSPPW